MKLYDIRAKRKGTDEPWTEWTRVKDFKSALKHEQRIKELGYDAKIVEVIYPLELLKEFIDAVKEHAEIMVQATEDIDTVAVGIEVLDEVFEKFKKKIDIYIYERVRKGE